MLLKFKKSQGILEYTLLLGAIVAIVVLVMMKQGGVGTKVKGTYETIGGAISSSNDDAVGRGVLAPKK